MFVPPRNLRVEFKIIDVVRQRYAVVAPLGSLVYLVPRALAQKLNPTNLQWHVRTSPVSERVVSDWNNPMWNEPAYQGSGQSHQRTMQDIVDRKLEEREEAGRRMISQVSAGSHTPILYPIPPIESSPYIDYAAAAMGTLIDPNAGAMPGTEIDSQFLELLRSLFSQWNGR